MALSTQTQNTLKIALASLPAAKEVITKLNAVEGVGAAPSAGVTHVNVTYTAAPDNTAAVGSLTIANGGTPTVNELLTFCIELNAKVAALDAVLLAQGLTTS